MYFNQSLLTHSHSNSHPPQVHETMKNNQYWCQQNGCHISQSVSTMCYGDSQANWRSSHLGTTTMVGLFGHTGTTMVICQWTRLNVAISIGTRLGLVCQWARLSVAICLGTRPGLICFNQARLERHAHRPREKGADS